MKRFFLIPLFSVLCTVMAWGANVAKIGDTEYATLAAAVTAANGITGDVTITMLTNSTATTAITISNNITIDGGNATRIIKNTFIVSASKTLTLKDVTVNNTLKPSNARSILLNGASAKLVLSDATIEPKKAGCIALGLKTKSAVLELADGTSNTIRNIDGSSTIYNANTSNYTLTIQGNGALNVEHVGDAGYALGCAAGSAKFAITAPNITVTSETAGRVFSTNLTASSIKDGVYSDAPADALLPDGYAKLALTGENAGKYKVLSLSKATATANGIKASVGKTAYTSLAAAIEAVEVGGEVKLWADAEAISVNKSIKIWTNGFDGSAMTAASGYARIFASDWGEDYYYFGSVNTVDEDGKTIYLVSSSEELEFAGLVVGDGDGIRLATSFTLINDVTLGADITFDLNDKTLTCGAKSLNVKDGVVTFVDESAGKNGTVTTSGFTCLYLSKQSETTKVIINEGKFISTKATAAPDMEKAVIVVDRGTDLEINGGRIQSNNNAIFVAAGFGIKWEVISGYGFWVLDNTLIWPANVTIAGGEIVSNGEAAICIKGNCTLNSETILPATVNMTAGSITASKHGVVVFGKTATFNLVGGTITATNGFGISGNGKVGTGTLVNTPSDWADYGGTVVTVSGGSVTSTNAAGIYQPQNGTVTISGGAVTGKTGLAIKSGSLNVTGGTITANGEKNVTETGINNGIIQTGAAISIESNGAYAGNMNINISSEAKLVSAEGYAIYEYVAKSGDDTHVNTIAVTNGKFQGGICGSQSLTAKGGFVSGGKWSEDVTANVVKGKAANPISEDPYFFEVGDPTPETAEKDNTDGQNAVLVNADASSAEISDAQSEAGRESAVTTTATNSVVVTENTDVVVAGDKDIVEVKKVTVEGEAQLTVTEGATLMVGAGSVLLDTTATTGGLTVEAGAALVVDGLIYGSTEDNFVIEGQEGKSAVVLFSPETEFVREDHPKATYKFKSQARLHNGKNIWQRFGVPTFNGATMMTWEGETGTALFKFDYSAGTWVNIVEEVKVIDPNYDHRFDINGNPFQCYLMTVNKDEEVEYTFTGSLMGNTNAPLHFEMGWNAYANSYTAPIDVEAFLKELETKFGDDLSYSIYLYDRNGDGTTSWDAVNNLSFIEEEDLKVEIKPMQAFILQMLSGEPGERGSINYQRNVFNPFMGIEPNHAPARSRKANNYNGAVITVSDGVQTEKLTFIEGEEFSDEFDNGYDAEKFDNENNFSLYCKVGEVALSKLATNDLKDKTIAFDNKVAGEFTLKVTKALGEGVKLYDAVAKKLIELEENTEYTFTAEAIDDAARFIINPSGTTAIDNTEVVGTTSKFMKDGQLYIRRSGNVYTVQGQNVK